MYQTCYVLYYLYFLTFCQFICIFIILPINYCCCCCCCYDITYPTVVPLQQNQRRLLVVDSDTRWRHWLRISFTPLVDETWRWSESIIKHINNRETWCFSSSDNWPIVCGHCHKRREQDNKRLAGPCFIVTQSNQ